MQKKNKHKGRSLERAVRFIQESILRSDPKVKGTPFTIETNKIVNVSGVRHEVDVFVKTQPGSAYECSWVFECKNHKAPVGKNEVLILAKKVEAIGANRGFLVARRLTKDANAQVQLDKRVSFVSCTDEFLSPLNGMTLNYTFTDFLPIAISIKERGVAPLEEPRRLQWQDKTCRLNQQPIELRLFLKRWLDQMAADEQKENRGKYMEEGTHWGERAMALEFERGELLIGDLDVERMMIATQFTVTVGRRKLLSQFELKDKGRLFTFEPIDDMIPGKRVEIDVVHRL